MTSAKNEKNDGTGGVAQAGSPSANPEPPPAVDVSGDEATDAAAISGAPNAAPKRNLASPSKSDSARSVEIGPGYQIGEYVIESQIGRGAFGTVYGGLQPVIGKRVAIKVLSPLLSSDPSIVARFVEEARAVNKIGHPNIVDIFSFGQLDDGRRYFVMERLDGQALSALLKQRGRLDLPETLEILGPVVRALDAAHAAGIAHRDLKPDNIFLGRGEAGAWRPKLLDFGVAKLLDESPSSHATETGVTVGTPSYMAPEQCVGKGVDHRADIYAFGVLAYRMLTGSLPFDAESGSQMMAKHIYEEPRPPLEVRPDLPPAVGRVILWLLQKDKTERPQTVMEGFSALEAAATGGARSAVSGIDSTRPGGPAALRKRSLDPTPARGRPMVIAAVAIGVLLVGGIVGVALRGASVPKFSATATGTAAAAAAPSRAAPSPGIPVAPVPAATPASPPPPSVHLEVRGVPAATLVRDEQGVLLRTGPGTIDLPRTDETRRLSFEAADHERRIEAIVPNRDLVLDIALPASPRHVHRASVVSPPATPVTPAAGAATHHTPRPNDIEPWK